MSLSSEGDVAEVSQPAKGKPKTGRVGGVVPNTPPPPPEPPKSQGNPSVLALLLLATLLAGRNALGGGDGSVVYSISSYSSTTVMRDVDGTGQPRYETQMQSSFSTNIPGLAEKVAERGGGPPPTDAAGSLLFPF